MFAGQENFKKEHELMAVNLQSSTDKNGMQNDKRNARKSEIKIIIREQNQSINV